MGVESQRAIIENLRDRIRRMERRPVRREGFLPSGRPEVDGLLPGGGFPRGALADLAGGPASGKTLLALAAIGSAVAEGGLGAFVDGRGELYPPAAQALGIDLDRLLVVRPATRGRGAGRGGEEGLWAAEALLASGAFAAVAVDVPVRGLSPARLEAMLRRLAAAAEKGGAAGLWLGPPDLACRVPARVRLEVLPGERGGVRVRRAPGRGAQGPLARGADHAA
jgi:protein ImuA